TFARRHRQLDLPVLQDLVEPARYGERPRGAERVEVCVRALHVRARIGRVADAAAYAVVRKLADLHVYGRALGLADVVADVDRDARVVRRVLQLPLQFVDPLHVVDLAFGQRIHV